jgi:hypothetical protein
MGRPTHAMVYTGGSAATMGAGAGPLQFLGPLRQLNGADRWYLTFYALPEGKRFEDVRNHVTEQYLQAAGRADAMMLDIRKAGGSQWGANWVRHVIGHPHPGGQPMDVAISMPRGDEMFSVAEVFGAEEAAQLFMSYHRTGDVPSGYALRPVEGYTADGGIIDLRDAAAEG